AFNVVMISLIVSQFQIETAIYRNVANFIAIEISLIFTFLVYRIWVWRINGWNIRKIFLKQLPMYHMASGFVILIRTLIIFPVLDWLGVSYIVNTFIGIAAGAGVNYFFNDQLVFKD
ncbi:MAG: GtrA family protein, partial [Phormidesmis sp.]